MQKNQLEERAGGKPNWRVCHWLGGGGLAEQLGDPKVPAADQVLGRPVEQTALGPKEAGQLPASSGAVERQRAGGPEVPRRQKLPDLA